MALFTKSIQVQKTVKDGIRICIMRRPSINADYDIWMPVLAPSNKLLDDYQGKKINWRIYVDIFTKEIIDSQKRYLKIINILAIKYNLTLLCWEKKPKRCHRRLVAESCRSMNPKLTVVIK